VKESHGRVMYRIKQSEIEPWNSNVESDRVK